MVSEFRKQVIRKGILLSLFLICIASCSKHKSETSKEESGRLSAPLKNTIHHVFSNETYPDIFQITLTGDSILSGSVSFEIQNYHHELLYRDVFPSTDLLLDNDLPTLRQQNDTILANFNRFFKDAFQQPAVKIDDTEPDDPEERELWKGIKSDSSAISFTYSHGYEGTYSIAYSKKRGKVVVFESSD